VTVRHFAAPPTMDGSRHDLSRSGGRATREDLTGHASSKLRLALLHERLPALLGLGGLVVQLSALKPIWVMPWMWSVSALKENWRA
jgi:hypothetical protein